MDVYRLSGTTGATPAGTEPRSLDCSESWLMAYLTRENHYRLASLNSTLMLSGRGFETATGLEAGFTNLVCLYLSQNALKDLSFVAALPSLAELHVDGNRIVDVAVRAPALRVLNIERNAVHSLEALVAPRLRALYARDNPLAQLGVRPALRTLDVRGCALGPELARLSELCPLLTSLRRAGCPGPAPTLPALRSLEGMPTGAPARRWEPLQEWAHLEEGPPVLSYEQLSGEASPDAFPKLGERIDELDTAEATPTAK